MSAVEQFTRAHLVTDSPDEFPVVPVALRYDPEADPRAVRVGLPGSGEWVVDRELLERGLRVPAASGDVSVWPCGRVQTVMEFHSPQGVSVIQLDASTVIRFLRQTHAATPVPR
ncbi:SsgA family sporulation/cell division regulator [Streptomyces sp. G45]|uniref:SsgA family sporulation/cell division regulator n=1 Tax=Streptomyces sp. G45 TaxID=3406627 RepID=UPI003C16CDE2